MGVIVPTMMTMGDNKSEWKRLNSRNGNQETAATPKEDKQHTDDPLLPQRESDKNNNRGVFQDRQNHDSKFQDVSYGITRK